MVQRLTVGAGSHQWDSHVVLDRPASAASALRHGAQPQWQLDPHEYFSTWPSGRPGNLVRRFIQRWTIETTFEESRAHLGLETQRQWSDRTLRAPPRVCSACTRGW